MSKKFFHEFKTLFTGKHFWISVLAVALLFSILTGYYHIQYPDEDLIFYLLLVDMDAPTVVALSICAFAYSFIYCQEIKEKIMEYTIARMGLAKYVIVRTSVGFLAGFLVLFIGKLLFIGMGSFFIPLAVAEGSGVRQSMAEGWGLRRLLQQEKYSLYLIWISAAQALKAGSLCLCAQVVSLYISEPVVVIAFPMLMNYFVYNYLDNILRVPSWLSWLRIYDATNPFIADDVMQFLYSVGYTSVFVLILGMISFRKIKRNVYV